MVAVHVYRLSVHWLQLSCLSLYLCILYLPSSLSFVLLRLLKDGFHVNRLAASTLNGEILSTGKAAEQVDRNGEVGLAVASDSSQGVLRKRQKVEKVTVIKAETSSVTSISSVNPNVKSESEKRLQQHETKQVKSNRDWRHLRPPGR